MLSYDDVVSKFGRLEETHLLIGNGFSCGYSKNFQYESLYEKLKHAGIPTRVQRVFEISDTIDFERAIRSLEDSAQICSEYGIEHRNVRELARDSGEIRIKIVEVIASIHAGHNASILDQAYAFLGPYNSVFTTNYDLLVYWLALRFNENLHGGTDEIFSDGFSYDPMFDDEKLRFLTANWRNHRGFYYLHGGVHLYVDQDGDIVKRKYGIGSGETILDGLRSAIVVDREYPIVVIEGRSSRKRASINANKYLATCQLRLLDVRGDLIVIGFSFDERDQHVSDAIAKNIGIKRMFVGLYGDESDARVTKVRGRAEEIRAARSGIISREMLHRKSSAYPALEVEYFDSRTLDPWTGRYPDWERKVQ